MTVISASVSARPLYPRGDLLLMGPGVYIHDMTPDVAKQWIEVLEQIAKENQ